MMVRGPCISTTVYFFARQSYQSRVIIVGYRPQRICPAPALVPGELQRLGVIEPIKQWPHLQEFAA